MKELIDCAIYSQGIYSRKAKTVRKLWMKDW